MEFPSPQMVSTGTVGVASLGDRDGPDSLQGLSDHTIAKVEGCLITAG